MRSPAVRVTGLGATVQALRADAPPLSSPAGTTTEAIMARVLPAPSSCQTSAVMAASAELLDSLAQRLKFMLPEIDTASRGLETQTTAEPPAVSVNWVAAVGGVTGPARVSLTKEVVARPRVP